MDIEKLSLYNRSNLSKAVYSLYDLTKENEIHYPGYTSWWYQKAVPRIFDSSGEIIFTLDKFSVSGLMILKKGEDENKLCQVFVHPEYRKQGICMNLLEEAFNFLGTEKPVITIGEDRLNEFEGIINRYSWNCTKIDSSSYNGTEYYFNK